MNRPRIIAAVPSGLMAEFFSHADQVRLEQASGSPGGFVRVGNLDEVQDLSQVQVIITSWGVPSFTRRVLDRIPNLRLIAHTGGTVKPFVTEEVFARGIAVIQAGAAMARSVAEVSLAFTLALLHRIPQLHHEMRRPGGWFTPKGVQHELYGAPIAVVGASRTGRAYLELVRLLGAEPLLVDPTVDTEEARSLEAELVSLDVALSRASIVALHAPSLQATRKMIGARELSLMRDGAGLVNTARSWIVDEEALIAELKSGRIAAAIDVFDSEPLPNRHVFRNLENVLLTPHRAAGTREGRLRQGRLIAEEVAAFMAGERVKHSVELHDLRFMA